MKAALRRALEGIGAADADELAYLALTSKPEFQVRDRLAYRLHQALPSRDKEFRVVREWKRVDLAVLKRGQPLVLLEAKAMTSYNVTRQSHRARYQDRVRKDLRAALDRAPSAEVYALVIVTHVREAVPESLYDVVKYARRLRPATTEEIDHALDRFLPEAGSPIRIELAEGKPFGLTTAVTAWLFGPIGSANLESPETLTAPNRAR